MSKGLSDSLFFDPESPTVIWTETDSILSFWSTLKTYGFHCISSFSFSIFFTLYVTMCVYTKCMCVCMHAGFIVLLIVDVKAHENDCFFLPIPCTVTMHILALKVFYTHYKLPSFVLLDFIACTPPHSPPPHTHTPLTPQPPPPPPIQPTTTETMPNVHSQWTQVQWNRT